MKKEHRLFIVLKVNDKWYVFLDRIMKSFSFSTKEKAEDYKQFLMSR